MSDVGRAAVVRRAPRAGVRLTSDTGSTLRDALRSAIAQLSAAASEEAQVDAELLVGHVLGLTRSELHLHADRTLDPRELEVVGALVARRAAGEPLQYVLGEWGFRNLVLAVDARALIPRPETEVVVERCLALLHGVEAPRVLDVGTGSGAIALAIADEHPGARVTGIDVSDDALALARENTRRAGLRVELLRHDLFDGLPEDGWDLVVSNPPYVRADEIGTLDASVVEWEPDVALVDRGQTDRLVADAARSLRQGGALVLETHEHGALRAVRLLEAAGYVDVAVTPDLNGRDRVVECRIP
jgi:release factor glutamine methyltransferase